MRKIKTENTNWNLGLLYKSDDDPQIGKDRASVDEKIEIFVNKWEKRSDYLTNPEILKEALDDYEELWRNYGTDGKEGYYFSKRRSLDQLNPTIKAKHNKVTDFDIKNTNKLQFFNLRLAKIKPSLQPKFLEHKKLIDYRHFLERIFKTARYKLSEAEEKILTLKWTTSYSNWVKMVSSFISKEERDVVTGSAGGKGRKDTKKAKKNFSEIISLISDREKLVRDSAAKALNDILLKHSDVAEAEINSILQDVKTNQELRKISRPDLSRHLGDDIETEIVDALIKSVSDAFDISKEYYSLKAKLMGVNKLEYHERNVPYGNIEKKYNFDEAASLVHKVFQNLDNDFAKIFEEFLANGQIDVFPKKGKTSGAYCSHNLISQPTFILLNHTDKLNDVLTLAHELGHGINNELIKRTQNSINFGTSMATAEVASTFMEDFVLEDILKDANDEERLAILMAKLNDDISTIFRQIACYKFEQELHKTFREKGYLSKEEIGKIFQKNMISYMGPSVEQSKGSENWWVYWSHIRSFFYVYSYASGLLISKSLQASVKQNPKFISKVKQFLATGLSESPRNTFLQTGIDISDKEFWNKGLNEVKNLLSETKLLARKLNKI